MTTWSVRVVLVLRDGLPDDAGELLDELTHELREFSPAVSTEPAGQVSAQLAVDARTPRAAFDRAVSAVSAAVAAVRQAVAEVVEVQVLTWAEFERRLAEPVVPPLVGAAEVRQMAGLESRQAVDHLARTYPDQLPVVATLSTGRVWLRSTWERFLPNRPQEGRPARKAG
jgi:hypothetical protein